MTPKVFERIYAELKQEVTSGRYLPGHRLQARALAYTLRTSTSPVTLAMRQLVGEDILDYTPQDSYIIPRVSERRLRDLFEWTRFLTAAGMESFASANQEPSRAILPLPAEAHGIEAVFAALSVTTGNAELIRAMANSNDRLRSTRKLEADIFGDPATEVGRLSDTFLHGSATDLAAEIFAYHDRRMDSVTQLVGLSYRERR